MRVSVWVSFIGAVPLSLLFLFAFIFVNGNFYKQSNHFKEDEEIKTNWRRNNIILQYLWIHLRKSSRNCRKKTAFTCAFGARLSFLSVIVYWIRSSGRSLLQKQTNKQKNIWKKSSLKCNLKLTKTATTKCYIEQQYDWCKLIHCHCSRPIEMKCKITRRMSNN